MDKVITLQHQIKQVPGNIVSDMDGEKVMLNIANGKYYNLGSVGGRIWELIEHATTVDEIVRVLLSEYNVPAEECANEVLLFLEHLQDEGLIRNEPGSKS